MGCEMLGALQKHGIAACGKHFPGHGDTEVDSHIRLPSVRRSLGSLVRRELVPFGRAMDAGVAMIMLGHLSVPALDPSGLPMTLSGRAVSFIREKMGYEGLLITDAMNMGGLAGYTEAEASAMALEAGVDLILHPLDPDGVAARLKSGAIERDTSRLERFRSGLAGRPSSARPEFALHRRLSAEVTGRSILAEGLGCIGSPFLFILNDDELPKGNPFVRRMRAHYPGMRHCVVRRGQSIDPGSLPQGSTPLVAVFSETRGWKGGTGEWLPDEMRRLDRRGAAFISFVSPYILNPLKKAAKVYAYWDNASAQESAADVIARACGKRR
jgi:hypothetical protein